MSQVLFIYINIYYTLNTLTVLKTKKNNVYEIVYKPCFGVSQGDVSNTIFLSNLEERISP